MWSLLSHYNENLVDICIKFHSINSCVTYVHTCSRPTGKRRACSHFPFQFWHPRRIQPRKIGTILQPCYAHSPKTHTLITLLAKVDPDNEVEIERITFFIGAPRI